MIIEHTCPCGATFQVDVTFGEDAQTYGPPERCHPGSADDIEPDECPECGERMDQGNIVEDAIKIAEYFQHERLMRDAEDREEARRL